MNAESSAASQSRTKSDYRTKLNPKKKTKDTQNYKPKYSFDIVSGNPRTSNSSVDSSKTSNHGNRKSGSEKSRKSTRSINDELRSSRSHSDETLGKFMATNTGSKNSLAYKDEEKEEDLGDQLVALPSKMWWVSPLKAPSNYKPPSITVSSKSYSIVSSISRPRIIRSAEDLRKKVISQCNLMEAVGYDKFNKHIEKIEHTTTGNVDRVPSNQLPWVPSLSLPSSSQTQSATSAAINSASPYESSSKTFLPQNLTVILHSQAERDNNSLRHFVMPSNCKVPDNSFESLQALNSCMSTEDFISKKTFSNQSSQYEDVSSRYTEPYYTVGDIARKHIVNPIATKLARLCTKQGQLYVDVIDDLEKSCKEFENACKSRELQ